MVTTTVVPEAEDEEALDAPDVVEVVEVASLPPQAARAKHRRTSSERALQSQCECRRKRKIC
jgi:hypothetical protein